MPLAVPKEPHAHIFQSSPEEIKGLTQQQNDLLQTCAEEEILIQPADQNELPSTAVPDPNSRNCGSIQKHEQAPLVQKPPKARLPLTDTTEILFPEDPYSTTTENGWLMERISPHAHSRRPTPSPTLSTTVSPELLRREPCPEEAPLHSRHRRRTISPKLANFSLSPMQIIKDVGQYFKKSNRDTSRTSRKRSINRLLPFSRRIPLDNVYLVDPEVVTQETMLMPQETMPMPQEMCSKSESHETTIRAPGMMYAPLSALSAPHEALAPSARYEASALSALYEASALSALYEELAPIPVHKASALSAQDDAPAYELELSYALSGTHIGQGRRQSRNRRSFD